MKELAEFNAKVLKWADRQPAKYRLTALAFGYPCNRKTHSFDQTLEWVSKRSRKRAGEGVSRRKLADDLRVFEASGVITVERRRDGSRNKSSVYHVDFDKNIDKAIATDTERQRREDAEHRAWLKSLGAEPPEDIVSPGHTGPRMDECPACQASPASDDMLKIHVANGGTDPWSVPLE